MSFLHVWHAGGVYGQEDIGSAVEDKSQHVSCK